MTHNDPLTAEERAALREAAERSDWRMAPDVLRLLAMLDAADEERARLTRYIDDARREAHEYNITGQPLAEIVHELYSDVTSANDRATAAEAATAALRRYHEDMHRVIHEGACLPDPELCQDAAFVSKVLSDAATLEAENARLRAQLRAALAFVEPLTRGEDAADAGTPAPTRAEQLAGLLRELRSEIRNADYYQMPDDLRERVDAALAGTDAAPGGDKMTWSEYLEKNQPRPEPCAECQADLRQYPGARFCPKCGTRTAAWVAFVSTAAAPPAGGQP